MSSLRRTLIALALGATALVAAGCGNRHEIVHDAETEGIYVDVGPLDYQVQISRQLNPELVPDEGFLNGIPEYVDPPEGDEVWFAVFLRVWNHTDEPHELATDFEIVDTQDNTYEPVDLDPDSNPFAYREAVVQPGDEFPRLDSVAHVSPAQGALVLFKLPVDALGNRPVHLRIAGEGDEEGSINLDL